jgi:predicted branched-subunit amino acid permease
VTSLAPDDRPLRSPAVAGAVVIVVALLLFPVVFLMSGAVAAAIVGALLQRDVEQTHKGSELLELNR